MVLIQLLMRTNTAVVFFAICAGSVLLSAAGKDTDLLANSLGSSVQVSSNIIQASLALAPGIVSAILLRKRVPRAILLMGLVPASCASVVGLTIVYPFLSGSFQSTLVASKGWSLIAQYYEFTVVVGIVSSLVVLAFTMPKHHHVGKHKKG